MITLLALHGAGRDAADLGPFCRLIAPGAAVLAPRGEFVVGEGYSFFQRGAGRRIDAGQVVGLARRWLAEGGAEAGGAVILLGYSSGAIFAAALLAVQPGRFAGAILLRPEPLAQDFVFAPMPGMPVLILGGRHDARRRADDAARLAAQLSQAGAAVSLEVIEAGHDWAPGGEDALLARAWLAAHAEGGQAAGQQVD